MELWDDLEARYREKEREEGKRKGRKGRKGWRGQENTPEITFLLGPCLRMFEFSKITFRLVVAQVHAAVW